MCVIHHLQLFRPTWVQPRGEVPTPPDPDAPPPPFNGAILVISTILKAVMSSATEAESGSLFYNCKEATVLRQTLIEMGHPQLPTLIQTDNDLSLIHI